MSTVEDFKNAPIAATATRDDGLMAIKIGDGERRWLTPLGTYLYDDELAILGYTLDSPAPTTTREALDLAWELAHPVKEGQVIPKGTPYLMKDASGLREYTGQHDVNILPELVPVLRTVEPLQDPEPDWNDALVVLARHVKEEPDSPPSLWVNLGDGLWGHAETTKRAEVWDLRDATPLYPKDGQEA